MIASVRGRVVAVTGAGVVVEVGGVGLAVECTPTTVATLRMGEEARLYSTLIVREDSLTLYGFLEADEKTVFEAVQTVSGVGPRVAQAMLAVHSPDALRRAVATEDHAALMAVPGIGKKGAQRLVLELRDRLGAASGPAGADPRPVAAAVAPWRDQLHGALLGLGWSAREADEALTTVAPDADAIIAAGGTPDVGVLLRTALRTLSRA